MKPSLLAIRSLAVEFIMRIYKPVTIIVALSVASFLTLSIWLTTANEWWWILVVLVVLLGILAIIVLGTMWLLIKKIAPTRTKEQKLLAKGLVDKIQHITEVAATPKILLWFQIARDVIAPSGDGFIGSISSDTRSLQPDFVALKNSFK